MPIKPQPGEEEDAFIPRCVRIEMANGHPQKKSLAICYEYWRDEHPGSAPKTEAELAVLLENLTISLEGIGPTILGAAVTNRPHIKPLPPIEIVGEDGEEKLIVPLLREGKFKHSSGVLDFTKSYFEKMIQNFKNDVVGVRIGLDNRHRPELGAIGWFEDVFIDKDDLLKGKVDPTPAGLQTIKDRQYRYASLEFHRDWEHPEIVYNSDEFEELSVEEIMPDEKELVSLEDYQKEVEARERLEAQLKTLEDQHGTKIQSLEDSYAQTIAQLEAQNVRQHVESIMLRAENYRDGESMGHPKVLLDWAKKVLMLEDLGEGDDVITLEDRDDAKKLRGYLRRVVSVLLETLPGTVPLSKAGTEPDKARHLEAEQASEELEEEAKRFWVEL